MAEDKGSAVDDFLKNNGGAVEPKEENPFAETTVEQKELITNEGGDDEPEEKPEHIPFHKDPKVQKFVDKQVARALEDFKSTLTKSKERDFRETAKESGDVVSAFEAIIGNDTPEKVIALNKLRDTIDEVRREARAPLERMEAEKQADREAEQELEAGFESIEEDFNVDFDSNPRLKSEFATFMERVAPKDRNGDIVAYPDFTETFRLFQESRKKSNTRNKDLAARGMTNTSDASTIPVPEDTSWKGVDKFFRTLKG